MTNQQTAFPVVTRNELLELLNDDLAGEFKAIISYVIYSQVVRGPQYTTIAAELEKHAADKLANALIIAQRIDYLGGMPLAAPKPVTTSHRAEEMLQFNLRNENETIARYQQRIHQCESLGEYAVAKQLRDILVQEQDHQIALANALGVKLPIDQATIETLVEAPYVLPVPQKVETVNRSYILANALGAEIPSFKACSAG